MKRIVLASLLFAMVILVSIPAIAQSNGIVKGVVKDTSGAVLPGAQITLTSKATQRALQTLTNETGNYNFSFLPPGDYSLAFEMQGFRKLNIENITVNVAQTVVADAALQVGDVSSELTVTADVAMVQTTTSDLGQVVESLMVTAVPLSSRNFTQVLGMQAGVSSEVPNAGNIGRNSVNISANGARPFENSVTFNGLLADNVVSQGFDDAPDKPGIPIPSPDAIQEFKVQTGLYDAEYGRQGGANVNLVTKSGTNEIHGTLYEFFRNDVLNANDFFRNATGQPRGVLKQNQYGGTIGGPIQKDKTFWFFSYQGTQQRNGVSSASSKTVNIPLMGDRSAKALGELYAGRRGAQDLQSRGVTINADGSNINPVALALLNVKMPDGSYAIPDPQTIRNGVGFSSFSIPAKFSENQVVADFDQILPSGEHRSLKAFWALLPQTLPFSSANVPGYGEKDKRMNLNFSADISRPFGPHVVNDLRFGYNRMYMRQIPFEPLKASDIGMASPVKEFSGLPLIAVSGFFTIGPNTNNDQFMIIHNSEIADTLSINKGKHDIRLGGSVAPHQVNWDDVFLVRGSISFSSFPDYLLGLSGTQNGTGISNVNSASTNNGIMQSHPHYNDFSLFVQDDWRASQQLTINAGLRYQYNGWQWDARGRNSGFDRRLANYGPIPEGGTYAGFIIPSNANVQVPPTFTKLDRKSIIEKANWLGFSPRVGIAFRPIADNTNFVVRTGYGLYWSPVGGTVTMQGWFDPWAITFSAGGSSGPDSTFQNPFNPGPPPTEAFPIFIPIGSPLAATRRILYMNPTMKVPYAQQWSFNTQYGFGSYIAELGYVGTKGTHLNASYNANQALLASPERPIHDQTTNTRANVNQRVPILGFTSGNLSEYDNVFDSSYHSLQASLRKQYDNHLSFQLAYTWSHALDNVGASSGGRNQPIGNYTGDIYNHKLNRGSSSFDRTHRFVASYLYELPGVSNRYLNQVLGGWAISGTTTLQSGTPFSITDSTTTIYGVTGYAQFAPGKGASDAELSGKTQDRLNHYFETSVFNCGTNASGAPLTCAPTIGDGVDFGNAGRSILRGPGQANFDMALRKNFRLAGMGETSNLEFRSEFFNVFNHPTFSNPGTARTTPASFGVISSMSGSPRIIQFALKYRY
jgi:hypothetical protein